MNSRTPQAAVLMSAYNGEKFLRDQIDSILAQTWKNLRLVIRDDGSSDGTREILEEYATADSRVNVLQGDKNLGYPACFYALTDTVGKADYYFFADQDDVWLPGKVERTVNILEKMDQSRALAYYGGYWICGEDLQRKSHSPGTAARYCLQNTMFQVCGLEFTMAVNDTALQLLRRYKPVRASARGMWMSMLYASLGHVVCDDEPMALYRRHESTVTSSSQSGLAFWLWRIRFFWRGGEFEQYKIMLDEFYDMCADKLSPGDRKMLHLFAKEHGFCSNLKKLFYPGRLRNRLIDELALRFVLLIGKI